jgi:hypothetical protein
LASAVLSLQRLAPDVDRRSEPARIPRGDRDGDRDEALALVLRNGLVSADLALRDKRADDVAIDPRLDRGDTDGDIQYVLRNIFPPNSRGIRNSFSRSPLRNSSTAFARESTFEKSGPYGSGGFFLKRPNMPMPRLVLTVT